MPNKGDKRRATVNGVAGVEQVWLQTTYYTTVDGRIRIANAADPDAIVKTGAGYTVKEYRVVEMADRWAYMCLVEYPVGSGHTFPGSDFIDMRDPSGLAKAETSAIGRALGLAGIAIDEGIASAEEMRRHVGATAGTAGTAGTADDQHASTRPAPTPTPVPQAPPPGPLATHAAAAGGPPIRHLHAPRTPQERMAALGYKGILYDEERNRVIGRKAQYTTDEMARWMEHIAQLEQEAAERAATPLAHLTGGTRPN